jgi:hypothetical protein
MRPNFQLDGKNYDLHFKNILFNHSVSEATPNSKITGAYSASCSPSGYGGQECVRHQGTHDMVTVVATVSLQEQEGEDTMVAAARPGASDSQHGARSSQRGGGS